MVPTGGAVIRLCPSRSSLATKLPRLLGIERSKFTSQAFEHGVMPSGNIPAPLPLARNRPHQGRYLDRREIGNRIGYRIGQDDLVAMTHGAAGVDDVGHITLAFCRLGTNQRFARTR